MKIAIDTDVLIYLVKNKLLERFLEKYDGCITAITEYEYMRGEVKVGIKPSVSKRTLSEAFEILELDNKSIMIASKIWSSLSNEGEIIDERDLLIGAICIAHNVPLWTFNKKHFEKLKKFKLMLKDINPQEL